MTAVAPQIRREVVTYLQIADRETTQRERARALGTAFGLTRALELLYADGSVPLDGGIAPGVGHESERIPYVLLHAYLGEQVTKNLGFGDPKEQS